MSSLSKKPSVHRNGPGVVYHSIRCIDRVTVFRERHCWGLFPVIRQTITKSGANRALGITFPSDDSRITCKTKQRYYLSCYITWQLEVSFLLSFLHFSSKIVEICWGGRWYFSWDFCDFHANYMILQSNALRLSYTPPIIWFWMQKLIRYIFVKENGNFRYQHQCSTAHPWNIVK